MVETFRSCFAAISRAEACLDSVFLTCPEAQPCHGIPSCVTSAQERRGDIVLASAAQLIFLFVLITLWRLVVVEIAAPESRFVQWKLRS